MSFETEQVTITHGCGQLINIEKNWTAGGVNDRGGYILKCAGCGGVFAFNLGRDISDSRVISGATKIDYWDDEVEGSKEATLKKHGLSS